MRKKRKEQEPEAAAEGALRRPRVTPIDIQQKEFRQQFRGYHMGDVDAFLDELTGELAAIQEETRRLREQAASGVTTPLTGVGDVAQASREAERIVSESRDEAARIVGEAEARALAFRAAGSSDLGPFLAREREFLQALASTIQGHAESVREMARAVATRRAAEAPAAEQAAPPEPRAEEPEPEPVERAIAPTSPLERTEPAEPGSGAAPAPTQPDIVRVDEAEEPPVGMPATGRDAEASEDAPERSLRDLFWGED